MKLATAVIVIVATALAMRSQLGAQGPAPPPPPPPEAVEREKEADAVHSRPDIHQHGAPRSLSGASQQPANVRSGGWPERLLPGVFSAPQNAFMRRALLVGLLIGATAGYLGVFIVLKRMVFVGLALAEVSSAGVALGLAVGINAVAASLALTLVGIVLLFVRWAPKRVPQDAFIGVGFAVASAMALLLVAASPVGEAHILDLLRGDILTVHSWDVWTTGAAVAAVAAIHLMFHKEILFTSFDSETAAAAGYNSRGWEFMLFVSIGLTVAIGIHATGLLFTSSCLVIPSTTALLLFRRMGACMRAAAVLGALPVPVGLLLSYTQDLPPSATIVAVSFVLLIASAGLGKVTAFRTAAR